MSIGDCVRFTDSIIESDRQAVLTASSLRRKGALAAYHWRKASQGIVTAHARTLSGDAVSVKWTDGTVSNTPAHLLTLA